MLRLLLVIAFLYGNCESRPLQVGLLCAYNDTTVTQFIGWKQTAGAISVAWDKIVSEQLLPGFEILNLTWVFTECAEAQAAGAIIQYAGMGADVILGPPCPGGAVVGGTVARFYNFPIVLWGPPFTSELLDNDVYPTIMATTTSTVYEAKTLTRIFDKYDWHDLAVLYYATRSELLPRCSLVMKDLETLLNTNVNTSIVYRRQVLVNTDSTYRNALKDIKLVSRVVLLCFESDDARRNFLLAVHDEGMDTPDFVYLLVESRRGGFSGSLGPIWVDTSVKPDGRDNDALKAARKFLVLDGQPLNDSNQFKNDVIAKMKQPPYNCPDCTDVNPLSSNVGELGDAMYLYALTLNRTIKQGIPNPTGSQLARNAEGEFTGFTGRVFINSNGTRDPVFLLYGLDTSDKPQVMLTIEETLDNASNLIVETQPESVLWATRGGVRPLNTPLCGYDGSTCPRPFAEQYLAVLIGSVLAGLFLILIVIAAVFYIIKAKRQEEARLNRLWQVPFNTLIKPTTKGEGHRSSRSLQSSITTSTKLTIDSKKETERHAFYLLGNDSAVARKHDKNVSSLQLTSSQCAELRMMRNTDHDNLCRFVGLSMDGPQLLSIWKYCSRGSLKDVIAKGSVNMDWFFKYSLIRDLAESIFYLHHSSFGAHGWITSGSCLVNERWQVKLTFYGLNYIKNSENRSQENQLWAAPEVIREPQTPPTPEADIYSFAVVCSEVLTKRSAWDIENGDYDLEEIIYRVKKGGRNPIRPPLETDEEHNASLSLLIRDCWHEEPQSRPNCDQVKTLVKSLNHNRSSNLMDHVFNVMEQYASNLEDEVEGRMKELTEEKKKSDVLLYRMLPKQVAEKLKLGQSVEPETFECVTLFFSDVVSFTTLASRCTPLQVVNLLNDLYTTFDAIIDNHDVYKVETIGDGYLCVSGLPHRNGNEHAKEITEMSITLLKAIKTFRIPHLPKERINIRVGLHTGSVVTGVVGITMPRYCLFGDAVNTASRMESNGKPGRIHISTETCHFLTQVIGGYKTELRGEVMVKGQGAVETYWLLTEDDNDSIMD